MKNKNKKENLVSLTDELFHMVADLSLENQEKFKDIVRIVMNALKEKDAYTQGHSIRVIDYAVKMGMMVRNVAKVVQPPRVQRVTMSTLRWSPNFGQVVKSGFCS